MFSGARLEFGKPVPKEAFIGGGATLYWRFARGENNVAWRFLEKPVLQHVLSKHTTAEQVLEIGLGAGNTTSVLLEQGFSQETLSGIEPNEQLLRKYQDAYPSVATYNIGIAELDPNLCAGKDVVLAHMVLNHVPDEELRAGLKNTYEVLVDGGVMYCIVPDPLEKSVKHDIDVETTGFCASEIAPWGGEVLYYHRSEDSLIGFFRWAGFSEVEVLYHSMYGKPLNLEYPRKATSPYFLKDHELHSALPQRMVLQARK